VIEEAANRPAAAETSLESAVKLEPASPEAWRRLGEYYLNERSDPAAAIPVLKAAVYLDPYSTVNRSDYLLALRAEQAQVAAQEAAARKAAAKRAAARAKRATTAQRAPAASP
jgi:hypothetical protein